MIKLNGELWMTARQSAVRAGSPQDAVTLQRRGQAAAILGRSLGLYPFHASPPPGCPWSSENMWPERIWVQVAWNEYNRGQQA